MFYVIDPSQHVETKRVVQQIQACRACLCLAVCLNASFSSRYVPTAVLSRQTAGLRGKSLILNLPGKPKAIRETIDEVCTKSKDLCGMERLKITACAKLMVERAQLTELCPQRVLV